MNSAFSISCCLYWIFTFMFTNDSCVQYFSNLVYFILAALFTNSWLGKPFHSFSPSRPVTRVQWFPHQFMRPHPANPFADVAFPNKNCGRTRLVSLGGIVGNPFPTRTHSTGRHTLAWTNYLMVCLWVVVGPYPLFLAPVRSLPLPMPAHCTSAQASWTIRPHY